MERTVWTDEMLDKQFEAFEKRTDAIVAEMRLMREELRAEIASLRTEMGDVRRDLAAFQRLVTLMLGSALVAVIGLLGVDRLG